MLAVGWDVHITHSVTHSQFAKISFADIIPLGMFSMHYNGDINQLNLHGGTKHRKIRKRTNKNYTAIYL